MASHQSLSLAEQRGVSLRASLPSPTCVLSKEGATWLSNAWDTGSLSPKSSGRHCEWTLLAHTATLSWFSCVVSDRDFVRTRKCSPAMSRCILRIIMTSATAVAVFASWRWWPTSSRSSCSQYLSQQVLWEVGVYRPIKKNSRIAPGLFWIQPVSFESRADINTELSDQSDCGKSVFIIIYFDHLPSRPPSDLFLLHSLFTLCHTHFYPIYTALRNGFELRYRNSMLWVFLTGKCIRTLKVNDLICTLFTHKSKFIHRTHQDPYFAWSQARDKPFGMIS